jgi:general secretion pathway protein L
MDLMRLDELWKRWIEILAGLAMAAQEKWRVRRAALYFAFENKRLMVRYGAQDDGAAAGLAAGPPMEAASSADLQHAASRGFVTLELPADEIVVQRINVPARAREFLSGIVQNQIECLSPWSADQVVYGYDAQASPDDPTVLEARVLITSQASVEAARGALAGIGVSPDRIVVSGQGAASAPPVTLWSRYDHGPGRALDAARSTVSRAVLAVIGVSFALSAWWLFSASSIRAESEEVAARSATLQRQLAPSRALSPGATLDPAERAWALKETSPAGVVILEMLSRALPDAAYVTELSLQKTTMRITGLTEDAPAMIAPLEGNGQFAEVHFFAPTTRGPDGRLFWFHIEARVEPRIEVEPHIDVPEH